MAPLLLEWLFDGADYSMAESRPHDMNTIPALLLSGKRQKKPMIRGYVEETVSNYSLDDFRATFRLTRSCMEQLCLIIGNIPERQIIAVCHTGGKPKIPIEILVTLYLYE